MTTKIYPHAAIYNGTLYPANTPIPVKQEEKVSAPKSTNKKAVGKDDKGTSRKS